MQWTRPLYNTFLQNPPQWTSSLYPPLFPAITSLISICVIESPILPPPTQFHYSLYVNHISSVNTDAGLSWAPQCCHGLHLAWRVAFLFFKTLLLISSCVCVSVFFNLFFYLYIRFLRHERSHTKSLFTPSRLYLPAFTVVFSTLLRSQFWDVPS